MLTERSQEKNGTIFLEKRNTLLLQPKKVAEEQIEVDVKKGEEVKFIEEWRESKDEIEELKKVYYQFLNRWLEIDGSQLNVNKFKLYQRQ